MIIFKLLLSDVTNCTTVCLRFVKTRPVRLHPGVLPAILKKFEQNIGKGE